MAKQQILPGYEFGTWGTDAHGFVTEVLPQKGKTPKTIRFRYFHDELTDPDKEFGYPEKDFLKVSFPYPSKVAA